MVSLPRLVIAAPGSGHGKTTIATGLMAALVAAGHRVSGHKVGPDYIDPGYHCLATGLPGRNLDPYLVGEQLIAPLLVHGAAELAVIEGVMGLYDGQIGGDGFASTAHVATLTSSPVVLVIDISHASRTVGAVVQGLAAFDQNVRIAGVILNKAGSARHATECAAAIEHAGVPVLGVLPRDAGVVAPSRHLGLVPAAERDEAAASVAAMADQVASRVDLTAIIELARSAPDLAAAPWAPSLTAVAGSPRIAVAAGRAFTFRYAETTEQLVAAGCEVVEFDPLSESALPAGTQGLYLGGGFPEVHAAGLGANAVLRASIREAVLDGLPTVAECAGLLYLCRSLDGMPMVGAIDAEAVMTPRLTLAYRRAALDADGLLGPAGRRASGHEFHRTQVTPVAGERAAWAQQTGRVGFHTPSLHASFLHVHWAGHPHLAQAFVDAASAAAGTTAAAPSPQRPPALAQPGLGWHGDRELHEGLVDFAVNVHDAPRPAFLAEALEASLAEATRYPRSEAAEAAVARRHGRQPNEVLATAGAAEAFSLIARMRAWKRPVIVHPQFTEPDVALSAAGRAPEHLVLDAGDGFALHPDHLPADADLVIVGNPTNPTSVLHAGDTLRRLMAPGRIVVVDEAFMDTVRSERHSLASSRLPGIVVIRSLTKLWAIPGIRAGYVLAEPAVIADLRAHQSPWSVSSPALAALRACTTPEALVEAGVRTEQLQRDRTVLVNGLAELGIETVQDPQGPFVLARAGVGTHAGLRDAGFAVRRCDPFPGLDDSWVRIATRRPDLVRKLLAQLAASR
jgi:cobyrinic acid a,c-diamide synthase